MYLIIIKFLLNDKFPSPLRQLFFRGKSVYQCAGLKADFYPDMAVIALSVWYSRTFQQAIHVEFTCGFLWDETFRGPC